MSIGDYTSNFAVPLSNFDTPTWIDEDWARWRMLDALIAAASGTDAPFVAATGAANAFVATYSPAITAYTTGLIISFKANNAVTGASTINVNGLGAKALKINGADTVLNDIPDESYVRAIYDGVAFALIDPKKPVNANQNIIIGPSGATANAATDFFVESAAPTYVELLSPNSSTQGYMFSRPALSYAGGFKYDHVTDVAAIRVGGVDVFSINASGNVAASLFTGAFVGNLTGNVIGNVTGNVSGSAATWATSRTLTLGTDASGNVSFNGSANFTLNLTIVANAITNAKLNDMATATIKGRVTAGTGDPEDLTGTQATTILDNVVGATQSVGGTKGLVPAAAAGSQHRVLSGAGSFEAGLGRSAGCVITTTSVNGSQPTLSGARNVASISTVTRPGSICSATITFTDALPSTAYTVNVTGNNASGVTAVSYGTKGTTTLVVIWDAVATEISVSCFS